MLFFPKIALFYIYCYFIGKGAFTYDVSRRGGGCFKMLTRGGGGLSLADVSKNT